MSHKSCLNIKQKLFIYLHFHYLVNDVSNDVNVHKNDDDEGHMLNPYNLTFCINAIWWKHL